MGFIPSERKQPSPKRTASDMTGADMAWATYAPSSIVGICYLGGSDDEHWVTLNAAGELSLWRHQARLSSWQIPTDGSPRSMASHPNRPLLAVAVKSGISSVIPPSTSCVQLIEITT